VVFSVWGVNVAWMLVAWTALLQRACCREFGNIKSMADAAERSKGQRLLPAGSRRLVLFVTHMTVSMYAHGRVLVRAERIWWSTVSHAHANTPS
jgi:hypothetical protein